MTIGYIIGAGPQGRIIAETWRMQDPSVVLGFLDDDPALHGHDVAGVSVVGPLRRLGDADPLSFVAVLAIGDNPRRLRIARHWGARAIRWATVAHPSAVVMPSAEVSAGSVVFAQAVVNSGARVGQHVIINTGVIVEHDSIVEEGVSLSPGVCVGGRAHIERGVFIGMGTTIGPRLRIGADTVIGAGATVVTNLPPRVLAYGVPARVVRPIETGFDYRRVL